MISYRRFGFRVWPLATLFAVAVTGCSKSEEVDPNRLPLQRLDAEGNPYKGSGNFDSDPWTCIHDPNTKLIWEVKSSGTDLRAKTHTYTWYEPNLDGSKDQPGTPNGGVCSGSDCDTRAYTTAVRAAKLCGFDDWRVPGHAEITTIVDLAFRDTPPLVNPGYFPNTQSGSYWTITTYGLYPESAWSMQFDLGLDRVDWKKEPKYLRLVRGKVIHKLKKKK